MGVRKPDVGCRMQDIDERTDNENVNQKLYELRLTIHYSPFAILYFPHADPDSVLF